jgi:Ser/Thr protein kinase RdoA (MazF antagonist)
VIEDNAIEDKAIEDEAAARGDDRVAEAALGRYGLSAQRTMRLINLSENATYRIDDPGTGRSGILRVHRAEYHDRAAIESELDWMSALGADAGISTPSVVLTRDDDRVVTVDVDGIARHAVLFTVVPGVEPDGTLLGAEIFAALGAITARLHRHSRAWRRPAGFSRFSWDWPNSLGTSARWGRWQDGIGVGDAERAVLAPAAELVRARLADYGTSPDRFGLIHADLRAANLLVDGDRLHVIDFDDCGFSWFPYDFAAAVSFVEHDPRLPEWQAAWLRGYRTVEPLDPADEQMLATFVMMRRLMLVAWMGSHAHSRECREIGPGYTADSCMLARRYLQSAGQSFGPATRAPGQPHDNTQTTLPRS